MYLTDSIGDMLTRIRNSSRVKDESTDVPYSREKFAIAQILKDEGYISKVENLTKRNKKIIRLFIKYTKQKKAVISEIKRVSTPGRRIYVGKHLIPMIKAGFGIAILSTSKGLVTDSKARELNIGGEVICHVW